MPYSCEINLEGDVYTIMVDETVSGEDGNERD